MTWDAEYRDFRQIVERLSERADRAWRNKKTLQQEKVDGDVAKTYESLKQTKWLVEKKEVKGILKKGLREHRVELPEGNFLYLPPLEKEKFVPMFSFMYDGKQGKIALRLSLCPTRGKSLGDPKPRSFSLRFEAPNPQPGAHGYPHAQICEPDEELPASADSRDGEEPKLKLPTSVPCVPVKAECPVTLLLCVLTSLYDLRGVSEILRGANLRRNHGEYLETLARSWRWENAGGSEKRKNVLRVV